MENKNIMSKIYFGFIGFYSLVFKDAGKIINNNRQRPNKFLGIGSTSQWFSILSFNLVVFLLSAIILNLILNTAKINIDAFTYTIIISISATICGYYGVIKNKRNPTTQIFFINKWSFFSIVIFIMSVIVFSKMGFY